jgi:hypothetical protein
MIADCVIENHFPRSCGFFECGKEQTKFLVCARVSGWFHFGKARVIGVSPYPPLEKPRQALVLQKWAAKS